MYAVGAMPAVAVIGALTLAAVAMIGALTLAAVSVVAR